MVFISPRTLRGGLSQVFAITACVFGDERLLLTAALGVEIHAVELWALSVPQKPSAMCVCVCVPVRERVRLCFWAPGKYSFLSHLLRKKELKSQTRDQEHIRLGEPRARVDQLRRRGMGAVQWWGVCVRGTVPRGPRATAGHDVSVLRSQRIRPA